MARSLKSGNGALHEERNGALLEERNGALVDLLRYPARFEDDRGALSFYRQFSRLIVASRSVAHRDESCHCCPCGQHYYKRHTVHCTWSLLFFALKPSPWLSDCSGLPFGVPH